MIHFGFLSKISNSYEKICLGEFCLFANAKKGGAVDLLLYCCLCPVGQKRKIIVKKVS